MLWNGNAYGKTKLMRISGSPFPAKIMIKQINWRMWNILNT
jgi:hypothetical protein